MDRKEALSNRHSAMSQKQELFTAEDAKESKQNQHQNPLITKNTKDTKEHKGVPQMNGDGQERLKQRAEALVRRIGEACDELERLAEENPELVGRVTHSAEEHKDAYVRLKARLELADATPRCRWVRQDGTSCGSPQMKKHIYCFAHRQMMEARALALSLPAPEDANAIQIGIMRIQKALIEGTISTKTAGLLLYSMQLALQNVGQVTFGQAKTEELVRETVSEQEAFSSQHSAVSESQRPLTTKDTKGAKESKKEQHQQQRPFIAEDTEDMEKGKTMPRTNADGRGLAGEQQGVTSVPWPEPVHYRVPLEMYRMDTREGREAYEAEVRKRIMASGDLHPSRPTDGLSATPGDEFFGSSGHAATGTQPRAAVPHEHNESRINLGPIGM